MNQTDSLMVVRWMLITLKTAGVFNYTFGELRQSVIDRRKSVLLLNDELGWTVGTYGELRWSPQAQQLSAEVVRC